MSRKIKDGDPASVLLTREPEPDFMAKIIELAHLQGWRVYHTHDSRRSAEGFPDLVLVRPPRLIFAEVKAQKGVLSLEQGEWLEDLGKSKVERAEVWRSSNWESIAETLR